MTDRFHYTTPDDPLARPLIEQLTAEYDRRYGDFFGEPASKEMNRYPPELFGPPDGAFVLLLRGDEPVAGGAFKRYDAQTAELKRIWTHEAFRRQGLARRVVAELEAQAVRQGYSKIFLTTGFRQPEARDLYLALGYYALFEVSADPEIYGALPFEKFLFGPPAGYVPQFVESGWLNTRSPAAEQHG
jgi:GNAT superfamily N-acetyltransferase